MKIFISVLKNILIRKLRKKWEKKKWLCFTKWVYLKRPNKNILINFNKIIWKINISVISFFSCCNCCWIFLIKYVSQRWNKYVLSAYRFFFFSLINQFLILCFSFAVNAFLSLFIIQHPLKETRNIRVSSNAQNRRAACRPKH